MQRITDKDLAAVVARINRLHGAPAAPYVGNVGQVGNYHISHAYGGVALHRMHNEGGGVADVLQRGHMPKRDLYELMHAYIAGFESRGAA